MTDTELEALLKQTEGHTPGSWHLATALTNDDTVGSVAVVTRSIFAVFSPSARGEPDADARLIAAAPTLRAEVVRLLAEREAAERALMLVISSPGWTELTESDRAAVRGALAALSEVKP